MAATDLRNINNERFETILATLNQYQRFAVNHLDGPLLVLAGPGTGKTHLLSARIGQILLQTDTQPHNILCLTYTDAGVHAMRERLKTFIGAEAHKVQITTFHAFCNAIIQDYPNVFGQYDLEPLTDLERVEGIRTLLDQLPQDHPLRHLQRNPYHYEQSLARLFEWMKAENWSVLYVKQQVAEHLQSLPELPSFIYQRKTAKAQKGEIKRHKIEEETLKMNRLNAAAELFPLYEGWLRKQKRYDFQDMINWVAKAFKEHLFLLRRYQEQFLYILVDEFQDTNGIQSDIIHTLAAYWDNPNVMVVGDDDQSVYEFQGARIQNMLDFYHRYPKMELVVLTENYRSTQSILNSATALIERNHHRLVNFLPDVSKKLLAKNAALEALDQPPTVVAYQHPLHEVLDVAHQIQQLHANGTLLREIAVVFAQHRQALPLLEHLETLGIAYQTKRRIDILQEPLVGNLLTILSYLSQEARRPYTGEAALVEMLHFQFLGLSPKIVAQLSVLLHKKQRESTETPVFWRDLIGSPEALQLVDLQEENAPLSRLYHLLERLLAGYHHESLAHQLQVVVNQSGLLHLVTRHPEKRWLTQVLYSFADFVRQETYKRPAMRIHDLLELLRRMSQNRLPLYVQRVYHAEDAVQFVTAHSAKGLEFEHVFMIGCNKAFWNDTPAGNRNQFALPPTLTRSVGNIADVEEAQRRLFYVAMTRAKHRLQVSYAVQVADGRNAEPAMFVDELLEALQLPAPLPRTLPNDAVQSGILQHLAAPPITVLQKPLSADELNLLLEDFRLTPTSLSLYLDCPLSFYYQEVLRVPAFRTLGAAVGDAVHKALEAAFDKAKADKPLHAFPPSAVVVGLFEHFLKRYAAFFDAAEYESVLARGKELLADFYTQRMPHWHYDVFTERTIASVEVEGVPLKGVIDRINFLSDTELQVADYKTGRYEPQKLLPPDEKQPNGGDFWRQMVFYKILLERYHAYNWVVKEGLVEYLEPHKGELVVKTILMDANDVVMVKGQIKSVYNKIQQHDFFTGCQKNTCRWCGFVKGQLFADDYQSPLPMELDDGVKA